MRKLLTLLSLILNFAGVALCFQVDWKIGLAFAFMGAASSIDSLVSLSERHPEETSNLMVAITALLLDMRETSRQRREERKAAKENPPE